MLAQLGPPEAYARQFLPEDSPGPVPRGSATLLGLAHLTAGGWRALPMLLLIASAYAVAGLVLLFVVTELVDPANARVFVRRPPDGPVGVR